MNPHPAQDALASLTAFRALTALEQGKHITKQPMCAEVTTYFLTAEQAEVIRIYIMDAHKALQSASREWMPVSEYDVSMGDVLVFGKLDSGENYIDRSSVWVSDTALNGRWTITFMSGFLPPTHFQHLPTPPAEEGERK